MKKQFIVTQAFNIVGGT